MLTHILFLLTLLSSALFSAAAKQQPIALNAQTLEDEYSPEFTSLLEMVYGDGLLSQGGADGIDMLFKGIDLTSKHMLDVGCGLGGVDCYLAKKHSCSVVGIDALDRLVNAATQRSKNETLLGTVTFLHAQAPCYPFGDNTFDIIFAKESFPHIEDKQGFLKEFFRILKPGGLAILLDWLTPVRELGPTITEMLVLDNLNLNLATQSDYETFFKNAGFATPTVRNENTRYIAYAQNNLDTIQNQQDLIKSTYGSDMYAYALKSWNLQKRIFEQNEVVITLLRASKPITLT